MPDPAMILCARVSWPVPAVREIEYCPHGHDWRATVDYHLWRCSWCGARVKVVA